MATGERVYMAPMWQPLDGSANNVTPAGVTIAGSTTQKIQIPVWAFDGAGSTAEYLCITTVCPVDYASGGSMYIYWTINSTTSANVVWQVQVQAITAADADTPFEHAWSTAATTTSAVNTTEARRLILTSAISLNMDSAAAGDLLSFLLFRDPANGSDTSSVDAEMVAAVFQYTTT